jgi:hypothetical protein
LFTLKMGTARVSEAPSSCASVGDARISLHEKL